MVSTDTNTIALHETRPAFNQPESPPELILNLPPESPPPLSPPLPPAPSQAPPASLPQFKPKSLQTALQKVRQRIRFALQRAQDGLLDYDTMDDVCIALTNALRELDDVHPEPTGKTDPPDRRPLTIVYDDLCHVCGEQSKEPLAVDRCRRSGRVRGLLCRRCHAAVEFLDADPIKAQKLTDYLKQNPREEEQR